MAPTINSITVVGSWATVNFSDPSSGDYTSYVATLASVSIPGLQWTFPAVPASGPLVAQMSLASLNPQFVPTATYQVTVTGDPGGTASAPVALPNSSPAVSEVSIDALSLSATWADIFPKSNVDAYTATLWQGSSGTNFPEVPLGLPMTATLALPPGGLDPNLPYTINVTSSASGGTSAVGPMIDVIVAASACATATGADLLTLTLSAPIAALGPAWTAFAFALLDGENLIEVKLGVAPAPSMTWVLNKALVPGRQYRVAVAGQILSTAQGGSAVTGPFGPSSPLILGIPAIIGTPSYDGASMFAAWTPIAEPAVTGYLLEIAGPSPYTIAAGAATALSLAVPLNGASQLSIRATAPNAIGPSTPSSSIVFPAVPAAPTPIAAGYDGKMFFLAWSAVASADAYAVTLTSSKQTFNFGAGAALSFALPIALDPSVAWSATVTAIGIAGSGPASAAIDVLVIAPEISASSYAAGVITAAWSWSGGGSPTFELALFEGGAQLASTTANTGATGGTLSASLVAGRSYTIAVRVLAASSTGPWSGAAALILSAPVVHSTLYDGTAVTASWSAIAEGAAGYTATLSEVGGSIVGSPVSTTATSAAIPAAALDGNKLYQVTVLAFGRASTGPASAAAPVVSESVAITSATYDGKSLQLGFGTAKTAGATYAVEILQNNAAVAAQTSGASPLSMSVILSASGSYSAVVRVVSGMAIGQRGASFTVLTATTTVFSGSTDPMSGLTTFKWNPLPPPVASFLLQAYVGGLPSGAPRPASGTSMIYPNALTRNSVFSVAIAGISSDGAVGPYGPQFFPPTIQPVISSSSYNGKTASIAWALIDGATGYQVSVLQSGNPDPVGQMKVNAVTDSLTFAPAITDVTKTYGSVVQAMSGSDTGPTSAQQPLFQPALFVSTSPATTFSPFIYPATSMAQVGAATLGTSGITQQLYLPNLTGGTSPALPIESGPFSIAANNSSGKDAYPLVLTILGTGDAWTFSSSAIRANLKQDYISLLTKVEAAGGVAEGIGVLQAAIGRALPQTFAETLYYACGFDVQNACAELRPGIILRASFADYSAINADPNAQWTNGWIGGSFVDYDVGSYLSAGARKVGFEAFISTLVTAGLLEVSDPAFTGSNEDGSADAADLYFDKFIEPYFRLFFPKNLTSATSISSAATTASFAIASAPTYLALQSTTNVPTADNHVAYFRGRAILRLCVRVFLNGEELVVPLGTTVRNLLERYAFAPPSTTTGINGLVLKRSTGPIVASAADRFTVGGSIAVRLDWNTMPQYAYGWDSLSLPLLPGDQLTIGGGT